MALIRPGGSLFAGGNPASTQCPNPFTADFFIGRARRVTSRYDLTYAGARFWQRCRVSSRSTSICRCFTEHCVFAASCRRESFSIATSCEKHRVPADRVGIEHPCARCRLPQYAYNATARRPSFSRAARAGLRSFRVEFWRMRRVRPDIQAYSAAHGRRKRRDPGGLNAQSNWRTRELTKADDSARRRFPLRGKGFRYRRRSL